MKTAEEALELLLSQVKQQTAKPEPKLNSKAINQLKTAFESQQANWKVGRKQLVKELEKYHKQQVLESKGELPSIEDLKFLL